MNLLAKHKELGICLFMVVIVLNDMTSISDKIFHITPVARCH